MKKKGLNILECPNSQNDHFDAYALELMREKKILQNIPLSEMLPDDDIKTGVVISKSNNKVYPIHEFVAIFLSDQDLDKKHFQEILAPVVNSYPAPFSAIIKQKLDSLDQINQTTEGEWNREEMRYYDAGVETEELRSKMVQSIQEQPIWRIFLPRKRHLINKLIKEYPAGNVLEIGCGNARTVTNIYNPEEYNYEYLGTDISFKRLLVAKQANPEGDYIQASAMNLPFKKETFNAVISFGMIHHLPDHLEAIDNADKVLHKNGLLLFHEPVIRKDFFFATDNFKKRLTKSFQTYEHSEHDGKLNLDAFSERLSEKNFKILHRKNQISIFRALTESVLSKVSHKFSYSKNFINFLELIDEIPLQTLCKISGKFGPNAVLIAAQKKENN